MTKKLDMHALSEMIDGRHQIIPILSASGDELKENTQMPDTLPILTLRSSVMFPGAITPITVGREKSVKLVREASKNGGIIGAVLQRDSSVEDPTPEDLFKVGTASTILKIFEMPNGTLTVILHGTQKFEVGEYLSSDPYYTATVKPLNDLVPEKPNEELDNLVETIKQVAIDMISMSSSIPQEAQFAIKNIDSRRGVINFISSNMDFTDEERQGLLEAPGLLSRAKLLLEILVREQKNLEVKNEIQSKVREGLDQQQREYFLHQQMRTIQEELGDGSVNDSDELRERAKNKMWSEEVATTFEKELAKLDRLNPSMSEYSVQLNYLELMLSLPWNFKTKDNLDLNRAKKQLEKDHYGLDDVKDRILEHLAVLKLKGDLKSPILCLYGAPGVGKTSLGKSVAEALGRKFARISLGGVHDESEIRGHRRTYIGSMPGRIIQNIDRAGSSNPVIILDEIDKVSASSHGDPSSALLEVLDPEQNSTFHDNYLDIDYDLSHVLFIATANNIGSIHPALRDRMEMINVSGYLTEEKVEIGARHLLPKQLEAHGIKKTQLKISKSTLEYIIENYTRESGVRSLDKLLAKIARYRAKEIAFEQDYNATLKRTEVEVVLKKPRYTREKQNKKAYIGQVTGLAWTQVGGEILFIESSLNAGKGALVLTGNLGDVMKESASIAYGWVKANAQKLGINAEEFAKEDLHLHVPEGAIPKDGPSAGITMTTAIVSAFTSRKVRETVAMTGEVTLRGRVLPVGGIKEKILAARRAGVTEIILCEKNRKDIEEIKPEYISGMTFHYVESVQQVLDLALV